MKRSARPAAPHWTEVAFRLLPFADAASADLPLGRLFATVAVPGDGGHARFAQRHLEPGDGGRTWHTHLARGAADCWCRVLVGRSCTDRPQVRQPTARCSVGGGCPIFGSATLMQFAALRSCPLARCCWDTPNVSRSSCRRQTGAFLLTGTGFHVTQTEASRSRPILRPEDKRPRAVALLLCHAAGRHDVRALS